MANKPRRPETIDAEKKRMSEVALKMISAGGINSLSMRKLADQLKISPSTIYNYFRNRDELYLYVLNRGFELLYEEFSTAYDSQDEPVEKLRAMANAFLRFGKREPNYVGIMFTLNVPKFHDYIGTKHEQTASYELSTALRVRDFCTKALYEIAEVNPSIDKEDVPYYFLKFSNEMIGLVSIINSNLISYMIDDIDTQVNRMLKDIMGIYEMRG